MTTGPLQDRLHPAALLRLAGPAVYGRGVDYRADGRVEFEFHGATGVTAMVRGTMPYRVEISVIAGDLVWSCSCPAAEDGAFCKHCVATGLAVSGGSPHDPLIAPAADRAPGEDSELQTYLSDLPAAELVDLIVEQAGTDWRLRERLLAGARAARGESADVSAWRRRIDAAFDAGRDIIAYREAPGWAAGVNDVIGALEDLCEAGHGGEAALLAEYAHRLADAAVGYVDDSDGWLSDISSRLSELHLRACTRGDPDPVELAGRLADLELTSELDGFHQAVARYAGLLGEEGLAEYRRLVEPRWKALPGGEQGWSTEAFRLREAMAALAVAGRDPDELISVRTRHRMLPDHHAEIARMLEEAGRPDEAIEWARLGLREFGDREWQVRDLREFLTGVLRAGGREEEALAVFWESFRRAPSADAYRRLLEEAGDDAGRWRERAVADLRQRAEAMREQHGEEPPDPVAEVLTEVLLAEGRVEEAWEAATGYGCSRRLWLTLARAREQEHPLDAVEVYRQEVFDQIDTRKNPGYRAAVDLLARIERLTKAAGRPEVFTGILEQVHTEHRAKRNLNALLDGRGW